MKGTKVYSIFRMRCPRCHEGHLFVEKNAYKLKSVAKMHDRCPKCGLDYQPEPGFYFGAAYVSYGLTVAVWVAVVVALMTFDAIGWIDYGFYDNPKTLLFTGIVTLLVLLPLVFRLSRSIWINFFVRYQKDWETGATEG